MAIDYREISKSVRIFVAAIVRESADEHGWIGGQTTIGRAVINSLALAWADAVREDFEKMVSTNPSLALDMEAAKVLVEKNGSHNFISLPAGMEMAITMVGTKKAYVFEPAMVQAVPMVANYLDQVREVMDAFTAVNNAKQAEQANETKP